MTGRRGTKGEKNSGENPKRPFHFRAEYGIVGKYAIFERTGVLCARVRMDFKDNKEQTP